MEKYSKFRDEATGIAPFQDYYSAKLNIAQYPIRLIVSCISTVFSVFVILLYFGVIRRILPSVISRLFLKYAVLIPLRINSSLTYEGERRLSVRKASVSKAGPGDVLLVNFVSPLDALIYESHNKIDFAFPTSDGRFQSVSTWDALQRALQCTPIASSGVPLSQLSLAASRAGALLVVFVEGTTTNGRGLLTLKSLGVSDIARVESRVYGAAIKYSPASAVTPTPRSLIGFLWHLSQASWRHMASIRISREPLTKNSLNRQQICKSISTQGRLQILGDKLDLDAKQEYLKLRSKNHRK